MFLLSIKEAKKYFDSDKSRKCLATSYATESDSETQKSTEGYCNGWYLRTPGDSPIFVACVNVKGNINVGGACTYYINGYYIRPALWISLE